MMPEDGKSFTVQYRAGDGVMFAIRTGGFRSSIITHETTVTFTSRVARLVLSVSSSHQSPRS